MHMKKCPKALDGGDIAANLPLLNRDSPPSRDDCSTAGRNLRRALAHLTWERTSKFCPVF